MFLVLFPVLFLGAPKVGLPNFSRFCFPFFFSWGSLPAGESPPGTTAREPKRAHLSPVLQNTTKILRKDPQERERKSWWEREKKARHFRRPGAARRREGSKGSRGWVLRRVVLRTERRGGSKKPTPFWFKVGFRFNAISWLPLPPSFPV